MSKQYKRRPVQVAVVGPLPHQMAELRRRAPPGLDLRLVKKQVAARHFPSGTDHVVLWVNFIDHSWQWAANKAMPAGHVHAVRGGLTRLSAALAGLAQS